MSSVVASVCGLRLHDESGHSASSRALPHAIDDEYKNDDEESQQDHQGDSSRRRHGNGRLGRRRGLGRRTEIASAVWAHGLGVLDLLGAERAAYHCGPLGWAKTIRLRQRERCRRRPRFPQHPTVQPHDRANEAEQPKPRRRRKVLRHEPDRRVLRERDDETGVEHAPQALADDQSRRDQRPQSLGALGVRRRCAPGHRTNARPPRRQRRRTSPTSGDRCRCRPRAAECAACSSNRA